MAFTYDPNYFISSIPNIYGNDEIRLPQIEAYKKIKDYFDSEYKNRNSLVVLPTGVGKTGVIALSPFGICKKRTLIITPGTTIRDGILKNMSQENPNNFWYKRKVFSYGFPLPNVIEYEGKNTPEEVLQVSNIVVLNVHKLQERLDSSLTNKVDPDFFDFIIIDEAHHSTAETWVNCLEYFKNAKVLKLTGTPFRTDGVKIAGELIYKYPLSRAMHNNYVKSLQNIKYVPGDLKLTIDNDSSKEYSVDEILNLGLRDQDWITRSVAYSQECSEKIVDASIEALNEKLATSNDIPHKIIAIACSITHAQQIASLYENKGIKTAVIYSGLPSETKDEIFKSIDNHRVQAVVNVAMLGEGYDHEYLSVAAIFRPFRSELPYVQFIGRVLRFIHEGNENDNIAKIISHEHLYLDKLWEKYKKEINESEVIKNLKEYDEILDTDFGDDDDAGLPKDPTSTLEVGKVIESNSHTLYVDSYLDTELIRRSKKADDELNEKIKLLVEQFNLTEDQARAFAAQAQNANQNLNRPDLIVKNKKKDLDLVIREELVPNLIVKYEIDQRGTDLRNCALFTGKLWYLKNKAKDNIAMLAMYYNAYLRNEIGLPRAKWQDDDINRAFDLLPNLNNFVEGVLSTYYNKQ
ncbi:DEAD/DEAH box helicase [Clostridium cylindrosporum]|uniref:DNA or RNA helicase of superfamily II n=1 Tax=Clostridium cylindrosporum DSM 605 TaxID=1121307 RepID=A0A0J8DAA0_CLOCY|nr:DEAD/DEAH box helicase family protein [Clostridium cylindrosporum]KMT22970.1 DNA or RNA helicase of superfamily II [Clostridium cylindrosporum DSM 605]